MSGPKSPTLRRLTPLQLIKPNQALVAAIIPVFNGAATIAQAIDSVLAQKFDGGVELIVVNDGSNDSTLEIVRSYGSRITVVESGGHGPAAARNVGVAAAHAEYIAFLDADDAWLPGKLARSVAYLNDDHNCVMVYSDALRIDCDGKPLPERYYERTPYPAPSLNDVLTRFWNILPSTVVMRRRSYWECGGFCEEFDRRHPQCEDSYFWVRAREQGPFYYLPEAFAVYRVPASLAERMRRRTVPAWPMGSQGLSVTEIADYVANYELFAKLVRDRYGAKAARLVAAIRREEVSMLTSIALTAMATDRRYVARSVYRYLLGYRTSRVKTVLRMAWACLPPAIARPLANHLTPRMVRFVNGPAYA